MVFLYAVFSFVIILTHQIPVEPEQTGITPTPQPDHGPTINVDEVAAYMHEIKDDETYFPFLSWLKTALFEDVQRASDRLPILMSYQYKGFEEILRTTPFPVPKKLESIFALIYDADRILAEKKYAEAKKAKEAQRITISGPFNTTMTLNN